MGWGFITSLYRIVLRARIVVSVIADSTSVSLLDLPPTRQQTRLAFALTVILLLTFGAAAPFANVQLPPPRGLREILLTLDI